MVDEETYSNHVPICPYCGAEQDLGDGIFYDEELCECECGSCEKEFAINAYVQWSWTTSKKDSPND